MPFVDTPLTAAMTRAVQDVWGRPVDGEPVRLYGGEESVSVWSHVAGEWPDADEPQMRTQGARLLARLHRALASHRPPPRPVPSFLETGLYGEPPHDVPALADPELDRWLFALRP